MTTDKLGKLLEKRETLAARIRREQAKARTQHRKDDTRRKILAGAMILERAEKDAAFKIELDALLARFLLRDDDRALFGLAPLPDASAQPKADEAEDRRAA